MRKGEVVPFFNLGGARSVSLKGDIRPEREKVRAAP
jgi:hypothetical protein